MKNIIIHKRRKSENYLFPEVVKATDDLIVAIQNTRKVQWVLRIMLRIVNFLAQSK